MPEWRKFSFLESAFQKKEHIFRIKNVKVKKVLDTTVGHYGQEHNGSIKFHVSDNDDDSPKTAGKTCWDFAMNFSWKCM